jgi:cytochrome P450
VLTWAVYFLASHPDIQEKVYEEITLVLGDDDVDSDSSASLV